MALVTVSMMWAAEPTVIFAEGFSAFTEGSEDNPATTDISSYSSGKLSKTLTGWSGKLVYEAGGMLKLGDGGNLKTTRYNMSANNGVVRITCRYRSLSESGALVKISLGYFTSKTLMVTDDKWHDLVIIVSGGTSLSTITIEPSLTYNGSLIDSLAVETSPEFFPAPEAYQPSDARGTSFTARWKSVTGATAYYLDVYSKDAGGDKQYVLHNDTVNTTYKAVSGLDENTDYYFSLRATNGTGVSDYSDEVRVVRIIDSLAAPVAAAATNVTPTSFTANWEASEKAEAYELTVYRDTKFTADTTINVLSEDFAGVTKGTFASVEFGKLEEDLDDYTSQPSWHAANHAFAAGNLVLSPFGGSASLRTPSVSLGSDGGKFTVKTNMCCAQYGQMASGDTLTVNLLDSQLAVLETKEVILESGYKDYAIDFTKGADDVYVQFVYGGSHKIFFDDITVSQKVSAGYVLREPMLVQDEITTTSYDVTLPTPISDNVKYAYIVKSYAETYDTLIGDVADVYSSPSNEIVVSLTTGVAEVGVASTSIAARNGAVAVTAAAPVAVTVADIAGRVLYAGQVPAGYTEIAVPVKGIVLVKAGNKAAKLVL